MARVLLHVDDVANKMTLKTMLETRGHRVVDGNPDVVVTDSLTRADELSADCPVLLLATASQIPEAAAAMQRGVYGYIFVPLQPGEVNIMVEHATSARATGSETGGQMEVASLEDVELRHILEVLRQCKFNQARAARALGIGRNTLWRKLKKAKEKGLIADDSPGGE